MLNNEMVTGLRGLSTSTLKRQMLDLTGETNADNVTVNSLYGGSSNYSTNRDYVTHFAVKFSISSQCVNGVCMTINIASCSYAHRLHLEIVEGETPLVMLKRFFACVKEELRGAPGLGEVAARLSMATPLFWMVLPSDSPEVAEYNGAHYHAEHTGGNFYRVHTSRTEARWIHGNEVNSSSIKAYNGEYYAVELMVPIYHNAIPFTDVQLHVPSWIARDTYQTVLVDGEQRYITLERPMAAFFKTGIHGYSTRIETVVPPEVLFQKGKTDLYAKRSNDETPFLGWELEACTNESNVGRNEIAKEFKARMPFLVIAKSDSSIAPEGFETVSVPATLDFWKETALADTLDAMRVAPYKMRSFKHSSCGFHVHVSRSALSLLDLQKMERFMHNPANRSALEQVAGRKANTYQNYVDDLFNGRDKLAPASRESTNPSQKVIDNIGYFVASIPGGMAEAMRQITRAEVDRRYSGYGRTTLFGMLYTYFGDAVSYSNLNRASGGLFNDCSNSGAGATMDSFSAEQTRLLVVLCEASPFFRWKFADFFTSIDHLLPSITYTPEAPDAPARASAAGYQKTKLPLGRKNSYRAAMESKYAVGKGMQRYDVLNTKNQNTVEFRLFKGTMNPVTIFRYFEFVDALVRYVATAPANDEGASFDRFIGWVMGDAFNVSRYENLVAFFVETKMYKRESIKRRFLPVAKPEDGDLNVVPKPKVGTEDETEVTPLYSLNTLNPDVAAVAAAAAAVEIDFEEEDYDDCDDYDDSESGCDDPDCDLCR